MSGTKEGGIKARNTNLQRNGRDFYRIIGKKGGSVQGIRKGFAMNHKRAVEAGRKGGKISRRGKAKHDGEV